MEKQILEQNGKSRFMIDTQTHSPIPFTISFLQVRHFKDYHGVTTKNVREVAPRARQQYASFAPYQVRVETVTSSANCSILYEHSFH